MHSSPKLQVNDIVCPIGMQIMFNPVTSVCGHAFEEENLEKHLLNDNKCPVCKAEVTHYSKTSIFIKDAIEKRIAEHPELLEQQYLSEKIVAAFVESGMESRKNFLTLVRMNNLQKEMAEALVVRARKRPSTKLKEALADCAKAREIDPTNFKIFLVESIIYMQQENYAAATLACTLAMQYNPNNPEAYSLRALLNFKLKKDCVARDLNMVFALNQIPALLVDLIQNDSPENIFAATALIPQLKVTSGLWACERGDFEGAIEHYSSAIALCPDLAIAYALRAYAYCKSSSLQAATADVAQALRINPNLVFAWVVKGFISMSKGQLREALSHFNFAYSKFPLFPNLVFYRGQCLFKMNELKAAIEDFDAALKLNPEDLIMLTTRMEALRLSENFIRALEDANTILSIVPDDYSVLIKRAYLQIGLDNYAGAMADVERVYAVVPNNIEVLRARAFIYLYNMEHEQAFENVEAALQLSPEDFECLNMRVEILWKLRRYQEAIDQINIFKEIDDRLLIIRGNCYYCLKNYPAALADFNTVAGIEDNANALYYRSLVHAVRNDEEKSLKDVERLLVLNPEDIGALCVRAKIHLKREDYESAIADYEKVLDIDPDDKEALVMIAQAYYRNGDFLLAVETNTMLIEMFPREAVYVVWRGFAHLCMNNMAGALEDYNTAFGMAPDLALLNELKKEIDAENEKAKSADLRPPASPSLASSREGIFKRSHDDIAPDVEGCPEHSDSETESSKASRRSPSY